MVRRRRIQSGAGQTVTKAGKQTKAGSEVNRRVNSEIKQETKSIKTNFMTAL